MLVPLLVLVIGVGAGGAVDTLYRQADHSRGAQVAIGALRLELENLQSARSRAGVRRDVAYLTRDGSAPSELRGLSADVLLGPLTTTRRAAVARRLVRAGRRYDAAASRMRTRAAIGSAATLLMLLGALLVFYLRSSRARLAAEVLAAENERLLKASRDEAITDELTRLHNRRALNLDFEERLARSDRLPELMLATFDLDGFKAYNDTFGHGAGDALLTRLGEGLAEAMSGAATSYRMGGDEFCIMARADSAEGFLLVCDAVEALTASGDAWEIGCSYGVVWVPSQAQDLAEALRVADQRMYANKASRSTAGEQTAAALVQLLAEQGTGLDSHAGAVAQLSILMADQLGLTTEEVRNIGLAAELHDIGKAAIPEAILNKTGKLDDAEWEFVRRHTLIGERIILAAPALDQVAGMVRSSHERVDGGGYPDGLAGHDIPIGSRIIAVADAFDAMVSDRPYGRTLSDSDAAAEVTRCAGTQFDADVVKAFTTALARRPLPAA